MPALPHLSTRERSSLRAAHDARLVERTSWCHDDRLLIVRSTYDVSPVENISTDVPGARPFEYMCVISSMSAARVIARARGGELGSGCEPAVTR